MQENTSQDGKQAKVIPAKSGKTIIPLISANDLIGRAGLRTSCKQAGETQGVGQHVGHSDQMLSELLTLWPSLTNEQRLELLTMAQAQQQSTRGSQI